MEACPPAKYLAGPPSWPPTHGAAYLGEPVWLALLLLACLGNRPHGPVGRWAGGPVRHRVGLHWGSWPRGCGDLGEPGLDRPGLIAGGPAKWRWCYCTASGSPPPLLPPPPLSPLSPTPGPGCGPGQRLSQVSHSLGTPGRPSCQGNLQKLKERMHPLNELLHPSCSP